MPIQFRCQHCNQKLSITRRKAGSDVNCPACAKPIRVPTLDEAAAALAVKRAAQQGERIAPDEIGPDETVADRAAHEEVSPAAHTELASQDSDPGAGITSAELGEIWKEPAVIDPWNSDNDNEIEEEFEIRRPGAEDDEMDMTSMVDVTFLLLIFFMITASFSLQKSMQTEAPEPEDEGVARETTVVDIEEASVIVAIDAEDNITVDEDPVTSLGQLVGVLESKMFAENPPRSDMLIEADYLATHGIVVAVTDAGMEAGMQNIRRVSRKSED